MSLVSLPPELETPRASAYVYYLQEFEPHYKSSFSLVDYDLGNFYKEKMEYTLDFEIAKEVTALGYHIADITESSFQEVGETFKVFTVELSDIIEDYNTLLQQEKAIKTKLGFYDKNIIMELV